MSYTISPNMSLPIPTVAGEPGPNYAIDINQALSLIDQHNHSAGSGVQITPSGININQALSMQNNFLTSAAGITFQLQSSTPAAQTLYVAAGSEGTPLPDLFYYDGSNIVQITAGGQVNATAASIPGESYAGGSFIWRQTQSSLPTTPANFDIGSVTIRPNIAATTNGVTITNSVSLASAFSLILPPSLPGSQSIVTLDNSGNIATPAVYPITTAGISSSAGILGTQLANNTITATQIANNTITATQIANHTITTTQISNTAGILPSQMTYSLVQASSTGVFSSSSTGFTTVTSLTITGQGRPIDVQFYSNTGNLIDGYVEVPASATVSYRITNTSVPYRFATGCFTNPGATVARFPVSSMNCMDYNAPSVSANYALEMATSSGTFKVVNAIMLAVVR